jgi:hypothetical protein
MALWNKPAPTSLTAAAQAEQIVRDGMLNDVPVILEDDIGLFPSDTLVTQLRLIQK